MRTCSKCGKRKRLKTGFHRDAARPGGYRTDCKECVRAVQRAYYAARGAERRAYQAKYYRENREYVDARQAAYQQAHAEKYARYQEQYRREHREEISAQRKAFREANPGQRTPYQEQYRREHREEIKQNQARWQKLNGGWRAQAYCLACGVTFSTSRAWELCHPADRIKCLPPESQGLVLRQTGKGPVWGFNSGPRKPVLA